MSQRKAREQSSPLKQKSINDKTEYAYLDLSAVNERRFVGTTGRIFDKGKRLFCFTHTHGTHHIE